MVVTFAPKLEVPDTEVEAKPVAAPSRSRLPVTVRAFDPPAKVLANCVLPVMVDEPVRVTGPLKVMVPADELPLTWSLVNRPLDELTSVWL